VHITSDRRYSFAMQPAELWERIGDVDQYQTWWPWLRQFDAHALEPNDVWRCVVRPPLRYTVSFTITLDEVVIEESITATIAGDIDGAARVEVSPAEQGCEVRLVASLQPHSRMLRVIGIAAGPAARFGHDWVLDSGAQQFGARPPG
jgi:hypothetical protein